MPQPTIESVIEEEIEKVVNMFETYTPNKGIIRGILIGLTSLARSEERKRCVEIVEKNLTDISNEMRDNIIIDINSKE